MPGGLNTPAQRAQGAGCPDRGGFPDSVDMGFDSGGGLVYDMSKFEREEVE